MTDQQQHPITPPPELVEQWRTAPEYTTGLQKLTMVSMTTDRLQEIATQAASWGGDQELDSCCEWIYRTFTFGLQWSRDLRKARRPKPKDLKEQALTVLDDLTIDAAHYNILRNALEQLND